MDRMDVVELFHGVSFPGHLHTAESLQKALEFPFQDSDVLIVSYPKSGTTWMQQMVNLIHNRGDPQMSQTVPNWARAPWLEHHYCAAVLEGSSITPRVITTHLPHHLLGPALQGSKAKVVYVSRNPKDVLVSFYHFHHIANFLPESGSFSEFLKQFVEGKLQYGSWFDHIKGWTGQLATMDNLIHITYEEMSLNLRGSVEKMSSFLGCELLEEEMEACVKHCSFSSMKNNNMVNYTLLDKEIMDHSRGCFMRRGKIGDWKTIFTEEHNQRFESVLQQQMRGCSLDFVWEEEDKEETTAHQG